VCVFACTCMYGQLLVLDIQPSCSCSFILCYIMFHCNTEIAERIKWWWWWWWWWWNTPTVRRYASEMA